MLSQLISLAKHLEHIKHVSSSLAEISTRIDALRLEVQDLAMEAGRFESPGHNDPGQLNKIESRLSQLYLLFKKYNAANDAELISIQKNLEEELNELDSASEKIDLLNRQVEQAYDQLLEAGKHLSKKRIAGAKFIVEEMDNLLKELGMPNGRMNIEVKQTNTPRPDGTDDIQFLFSANKGMDLLPLHAVASGGELSRVSLALKSLYASQSRLPTLIFDEIDTGISGETAWRMGQMIRQLAKTHQVLMITHSPQVAAHANHQYHVAKRMEGDKDVSVVQLLKPDMRLTEIAKMLSGDPPSKEAMANAKSLIASVGKSK
jgi:DNA repair protein RecN (Recombination protein N)